VRSHQLLLGRRGPSCARGSWDVVEIVRVVAENGGSRELFCFSVRDLCEGSSSGTDAASEFERGGSG
jgi:hypothetical protein